jgi:hypothetical protein
VASSLCTFNASGPHSAAFSTHILGAQLSRVIFISLSSRLFLLADSAWLVLGGPRWGPFDNPNDMGGQNYTFHAGALVSLSAELPSSTYYRPPVSYNQPSPQTPQGYPPPTYGEPPAPFDPSSLYNQGPPGPQGMSPPPGAMMTPPPHAVVGAKKDSQLSSPPAQQPPTYHNTYFPNAPQHIPGFNLNPNAVPLELTEPFAVYGQFQSILALPPVFFDTNVGKIYAFWKNAGDLNSIYGRPL